MSDKENIMGAVAVLKLAEAPARAAREASSVRPEPVEGRRMHADHADLPVAALLKAAHPAAEIHWSP